MKLISAYDNELVVEEYYNTMQNLQKEFANAKHRRFISKPQIISNTLGCIIFLVV
jgi:hypothetical protein